MERASAGNAQSIGRGRTHGIKMKKVQKRKKATSEDKPMSIQNIAETAKKELRELTGFTSPALVGARKEGAGWVFSIELVEKKSIPEGMDIIGFYEVNADASGNVVEYKRKNSRKRIDNVSEEPSGE